MPLYKRCSFIFFSIEEDKLLDIRALLSGSYEVSRAPKLFALSPLTSSQFSVSPGDLELLLAIPDDHWTAEDEILKLGVDPARLEEMAHQGLLLSDDDDPYLSQLRHRADLLESEKWHPYSAMYHFMTRGTEIAWGDEVIDYATMEAAAMERAQQFVAEHGPAPEPFHTLRHLPTIDLPLAEGKGDLYEILRRRRTTRAFDAASEMTVEQLSTLLYFVFGCHGYLHLSPEVTLIHRTSPSGGSRHPIEVYPLVLRVRDLDAGLYHYDMHNHSLEQMAQLDLRKARELAVEFSNGQEHVASAHVIFIMTARYFCNYWKYQHSSRTYSVILMDLAHLSQTFYLVATNLNLGAFFTAAVNAPQIDETLGLDGYQEGAMAMFGCGVKAPADAPDLGLNFQPFVPRKTKLRS